MVPRLPDDAATAGLAGLDWTREGNALVKQSTAADFAAAMAFVNAVASLAEQANHHPDIAISWNRVTLRLTTHSAGGLSQLDLDLARQIDGIG